MRLARGMFATRFICQLAQRPAGALQLLIPPALRRQLIEKPLADRVLRRFRKPRSLVKGLS
jgi:hypothetical protein